MPSYVQASTRRPGAISTGATRATRLISTMRGSGLTSIVSASRMSLSQFGGCSPWATAPAAERKPQSAPVQRHTHAARTADPSYQPTGQSAGKPAAARSHRQEAVHAESGAAIKSASSSLRMRNALRILKYIALLLLAAVLVLAVYVWRTWDRVWDVPPPDLHASSQPEAIEHGKYLVYGPAHCVLCLSARSTLPTSPRMRKPVSAGIRIPRLRVCCAMQYARTVGLPSVR